MIIQTPAGCRLNASAPPLRVPGGQPVRHDSAGEIGSLTLAQMIRVRDLIRDATAAPLTERQRGALTDPLDEIILGIGTVAWVAHDYPADRAAAEAECWQRVAGKFSELAGSRAL